MSTSPKTILITGATSGIGRHAALYLARRGYHVIASGRRQNALDELTAEAKDEGLKLDALRLDVTSAESIEAARLEADRLTDGHGVDVLVNNAGFGYAAPMAETTDADMRAMFNTNVFGLMAVTQAFIPQMRERGFGKIINVSSVGGKLTMPFFGAYNATKYAVESMSDALRYELKPFGIDVVVVEPGVINTNFADTSLSKIDKYNREDSAYAAVWAQVDSMRDQIEKMGVGPKVISRAIHRAVKSRRPSARYMAPFKARIMVGAYKATPTSWTDALFRRVFHLRRKDLLPAGSQPAQLTPKASSHS